MQAPVLCECIDARTGTIFTAGGKKPVFIMQLHNEAINEPLIKYLNCNSTTEGKYKVPHNSDFAKLYRSTIGKNPTKRFSEAHKLLNHFLGCWFIARYENAELKKGQHYLKITHIEPETPARNDTWTLDGTLKKTNKKTPFLSPEAADKQRISWGQSGENQGINGGKVGDDETPQAAISLRLAPVFHPTKTLATQGKITNTQDHPSETRSFNSDQRENINEDYQERAAIIEYEGGLSRSDAETQAQEIIRKKYNLSHAQLDDVLNRQGVDAWLRDYDGIQQGQTA
jgi:hypothetical protein